MAYASTTQAPGASFLERAFSAFGLTAEKMIRRKIYRTTLSELQGLSNADLADLGMARAELHRVAWEAAYGPDSKI